MRLPLISPISINSESARPFPALDKTGKIMPVQEDGMQAKTFSVDSVDCRDFISGGQEVTFSLGVLPKNSWKVTITDCRITFWNSYTKGVIGKAKEKSGKVSAGHLMFESLIWISAFYAPEDQIPTLILTCQREDGTTSGFAIQSGSLETLKELATELHRRVDAFITKHGTKIVANDSADENRTKALHMWDEFESSVFKNTDSEIKAMVIAEEVELVPNSRVI